jgi:nucleoside-diphosphate-sugar epimerase
MRLAKMTNPRPILVTGATGSIGARLVKRLCKSGQSVRALVRNLERAVCLQGLPNLEILPGDLGRPESLAGCAQGCSQVYHCAAQMPTRDWARARAVNIAGTRAIIEESARAGVEHLIYTSSIGVYGISQAEVITEETPFAPYHQAYFETKQEADRIMARSMERLPITIARVGDVTGPDQYSWTIDPIQKMKRGLMMWPPEAVCGYLNTVYIDNLLDALLLMRGHPAAPGQVFNIVDGEPIRSSDYFRRLAQIAGQPVRQAPVSLLKAGAALLEAGDLLRGRWRSSAPAAIDYLLRKGKIFPEKLHSVLGWSPAIPLGEGFRRTQEWLRQTGQIA